MSNYDPVHTTCEPMPIVGESEVIYDLKDNDDILHRYVEHRHGVEVFECSPLMELALGEIATGNITEIEE